MRRMIITNQTLLELIITICCSQSQEFDLPFSYFQGFGEGLLG